MTIPTESWIIYRDHTYQALPWPFAQKPFDAFLAAPESLPHACADFGRVPCCDGLSETPSVPAHLPRALPVGKHAFAVYHDSQYLYAFLESHDGPYLITDAQFDAIPHMAAVHRRYPCLTLFTPDNRYVCMFSVDATGAKSVRFSPTVYGPRRAPAIKRDFPFDYAIVPLADQKEIACWRIPRAAIADFFEANKLKLSISRLRLQTNEHVAWGSAGVWGPRFDEMGTVLLVDKPATPDFPAVKRIDLAYEPSAETGALQMTWDAPYTPEEIGAPSPYPYKRSVDWSICTARINAIRQILPLAGQTQTAPFALPDGHTLIEIASTGGPGARLTLEKRSGNRIVEPAFSSEIPAPPAMDLKSFTKRTAAELNCQANELLSRAAQGADRKYVHLELLNSTLIGLFQHYLDSNPQWLTALKSQADYALSLQRSDGTFAGYHLMDKKPGPWAGGSFDTGQAGELWMIAYATLKDPKYLQASTKLVHAYKDYRVEFNHNYAAFTMYHLCAHYRLTQDPLALQHAIYYAQNIVSTDLMPLGFHGAHNYYGCYGSITLRGLAHLAHVLPDSHPFKPVLTERCIRMTNQAISRMQPDGTVDTRDRYFIAETWWMWGFFPVAYLLGKDDAIRLDRVIQRLLHSPESSLFVQFWFDNPQPQSTWQWIGPKNIPLGRAAGFPDAIRYYAHRDQILAGQKINPIGMV
jgi:hypothetical protein